MSASINDTFTCICGSTLAARCDSLIWDCDRCKRARTKYQAEIQDLGNRTINNMRTEHISLRDAQKHIEMNLLPGNISMDMASDKHRDKPTNA